MGEADEVQELLDLAMPTWVPKNLIPLLLVEAASPMGEH